MNTYLVQRVRWQGSSTYGPDSGDIVLVITATSPKDAVRRVGTDSRIVGSRGYAQVRVTPIGPFDAIGTGKTVDLSPLPYRDYDVYVKPVVESIEARA